MDTVFLLETQNHVEVLSSYIAHFTSLTSTTIIVFTNESNKEQIKTLGLNPNVIWKDLTNHIRGERNKKELLILTSPGSLKKLRIDPHIRIYQVIHNVHHEFQPSMHFFLLNYKSVGSYMRAVLQHQINRKYLDKLNGLIFIDEAVRSYFKNQFNIQHNLNLLVIPTTQPYLRQWKIRGHEDRKTIIIPGEMSVLRRSYKILSHLIENAKLRLNLIFLGKGNKKILNEFHIRKSSNVDIISYENHLPIKMYYEILLSGDLIILPLNYHKYYGGIKEIVGKSTFSAIYMDVLSSGIPALIPQGMMFHKEFENFMFEYADPISLFDQAMDYFSKDYKILKNDFVEISQNMFKEIFQRNLQSLQSIIDVR